MTGSPRLDYVSQIDLPVQLRVADVETAPPTISGQFLKHFEAANESRIANADNCGKEGSEVFKARLSDSQKFSKGSFLLNERNL